VALDHDEAALLELTDADGRGARRTGITGHELVVRHFGGGAARDKRRAAAGRKGRKR
jgi:hypothetical protein